MKSTPPLLILAALLLPASTALAQTYAAQPAYPSRTGNSNANVLRMRCSVSGSRLTFEVSKLDGSRFQNSGTMIIRVGSRQVFGTPKASRSYYAGAYSTTLSFDVSSTHPAGQVKNYYGTTSNSVYYTAPVTVSASTPRVAQAVITSPGNAATLPTATSANVRWSLSNTTGIAYQTLTAIKTTGYGSNMNSGYVLNGQTVSTSTRMYALSNLPPNTWLKFWVETTAQSGYSSRGAGLWFRTGSAPVVTTYSVSGYVRDAGGAGVAGAVVRLSSGSQDTTDPSGGYSFAGLSNGVYTLGVTKSGSTVTPASQAVTISGASRTMDFVAVTIVQPPQTVGAPTITPRGGASVASVLATISAASPSDEVRYTTDGTEPTQSTTLYLGPFLIASTTVLKAKAFRIGANPSPTSQESYTINLPVTPPGSNPSADEVYQELDRLSQQYQVPRDLMAAIVYQESGWEQVWSRAGSQNYSGAGTNYPYGAGDPKLGYDHDASGRLKSVGIGLTQLTLTALGGDSNTLDSNHGVIGTVDVQRLKDDWRYNLEQGFRVLKEKWKVSNKSNHYPGGDDPNVLENWYYPTAYYNGSAAYVSEIWAHLLQTPGPLSGRVNPRDLLLPGEVRPGFTHDVDVFTVQRSGQDARWMFKGEHVEMDLHLGNLMIAELNAVVLRPGARSQLGYPFRDIGFVVVSGSGFHGGDDVFSDDFSRPAAIGVTRGEQILSVAAGRVVFVGTILDSNGQALDAYQADYGRQVIVLVETGVYVRYAHLERVDVAVGTMVRLGSPIGTVGDTTNLGVTGAIDPHLHVVLYMGITDTTRIDQGRVVSRVSGAATVHAAAFDLMPRVVEDARANVGGGTNPVSIGGAPTTPTPTSSVAQVPTPRSVAPAPSSTRGTGTTPQPEAGGGSSGGGGGCSVGEEPAGGPTGLAFLLLFAGLVACRLRTGR